MTMMVRNKFYLFLIPVGQAAAITRSQSSDQPIRFIWRRMAAIVPRLPAAMRRLRAIEERLGLRAADEGR